MSYCWLIIIRSIAGVSEYNARHGPPLTAHTLLLLKPPIPCYVWRAPDLTHARFPPVRPPETGYAVAVSPTPQGPFRTVRTNVAMPGHGRIGDMDLFVDQGTQKA